MATRKINKTVRVWCTEDSVSHIPTTDKHKPQWVWQRNPYETECYYDVERALLEAELRSSGGLRWMVENGVLKIKDSAIIENFRLDIDEEYIKDKDELKDFVLNCDEDTLEDFLQFAPDAMLLNIESIFSKVELNSRAKIKLIKSYTGTDLEEFYKDMDDEGVKLDVEQVKTKSGKTTKKQPRKPVAEK